VRATTAVEPAAFHATTAIHLHLTKEHMSVRVVFMTWEMQAWIAGYY